MVLEARNNVITIMKVIATVLVLFIHGANIYGYSGNEMPSVFFPFASIANSAVPVFMAVSGYLMFKKPVKWEDNFKKKCFRLALPFIIWSSFWGIFEILGHYLLPLKFENILALTPTQFCLKVFGIPFYRSPLYNPLWYVRDLFLVSVMSSPCYNALNRYPFAFLAFSILAWFSPINLHLRETLTFFTLGGVIATTPKVTDILRKCWIVMPFSAGVFFSVLPSSFFNRVSILAMVWFLYLVSKALADCTTICKCCNNLIKYSFIIYVIHGKPLSVAQVLYSERFFSLQASNIGYIVIPALMFIICLAFGYIFKSLMPHTYKICNGEK